MSTRPRRTAIVPRAVFAAVVTLSSVPACTSHAPRAGRAAELRPIAPPRASSPTPAAPRAPPAPPVATLDPLSMPYRPDDAVDAGAAPPTGHAKHRARRVLPPPPGPNGVVMFTVAYFGVAVQ